MRFVLPLVLLAGCTAASPAVERSAIINGHVELGRANIVKLTTALDGGKASQCTATLIGTRTVLTAAHCLDGRTAAPVVELADGSFATVRGIDVPNTYDPANTDEAGAATDIAVLGLDRDIATEPARVATRAPYVGEGVYLLGYGVTANDANDYGTLRAGGNVIADVAQGYYRVDDTDSAHSTVCHGDSGGPDLVTAEGVEYVAGVHSRGSCENDWLFGLWDRSVAFATRTDAQLTFITQKANGNLYGGDGRYEKAPPTASLKLPDMMPPGQSFDVVISAADDVRVAAIDLVVDGSTVMQKLYDQASVVTTYGLTLGEGVHAMEAIVRDGALHETHTVLGFYVDASGAVSPDQAPVDGTDGGAQANGCDLGGRAPLPLTGLLLVASWLVLRRRATATAAR